MDIHLVLKLYIIENIFSIKNHMDIDKDKINLLDTKNIYQSISFFPQQVEQVIADVDKLVFPSNYKNGDNIAISGMGGSIFSYCRIMDNRFSLQCLKLFCSQRNFRCLERCTLHHHEIAAIEIRKHAAGCDSRKRSRGVQHPTRPEP